MKKLENISESSSMVSNTEESTRYRVQDKGYQEFNPQYRLEEENLNVNPLSARSCRCYPCKC